MKFPLRTRVRTIHICDGVTTRHERVVVDWVRWWMLPDGLKLLYAWAAFNLLMLAIVTITAMVMR